MMDLQKLLNYRKFQTLDVSKRLQCTQTTKTLCLRFLQPRAALSFYHAYPFSAMHMLQV